MLTVLLQQGINGIVVGSLYVLVALGLTLIYGVLIQINFAHADIVTLVEKFLKDVRRLDLDRLVASLRQLRAYSG